MMDAAPQLVIRNTFLELFDDVSPLVPRDPRSRIMSDISDMKLHHKVRSYGGFNYQCGDGKNGSFNDCEEGTPGLPHVPNLSAYSSAYPSWWNSVSAPTPYYPWYSGTASPNVQHQGNSVGKTRSRRSSVKSNNSERVSVVNIPECAKTGGRMTGPNQSVVSTQQKSRPVVCASPSSAEINDQAKGDLTTVMLRNIPNRYTQSMLLEVLIEQGFRGLYDFVYLPMDFRNGVNLGYAFVNLITNEDALHFMQVFQGFSKWFVDSVKVCEVSWAHPHQGRHQHVERYRNSPVMHPSMPDDYKPMVFKKGMRVPFPPPTKVIRAPKLRPIRDRAPSGSGTPPPGGNRIVEMPTEQQGPPLSNICTEMSQKSDHLVRTSQPHVPAAWGG